MRASACLSAFARLSDRRTRARRLPLRGRGGRRARALSARGREPLDRADEAFGVDPAKPADERVELGRTGASCSAARSSAEGVAGAGPPLRVRAARRPRVRPRSRDRAARPAGASPPPRPRQPSPRRLDGVHLAGDLRPEPSALGGEPGRREHGGARRLVREAGIVHDDALLPPRYDRSLDLPSAADSDRTARRRHRSRARARIAEQVAQASRRPVATRPSATARSASAAGVRAARREQQDARDSAATRVAEHGRVGDVLRRAVRLRAASAAIAAASTLTAASRGPAIDLPRRPGARAHSDAGDNEATASKRALTSSFHSGQTRAADHASVTPAVASLVRAGPQGAPAREQRAGPGGGRQRAAATHSIAAGPVVAKLKANQVKPASSRSTAAPSGRRQCEQRETQTDQRPAGEQVGQPAAQLRPGVSLPSAAHPPGTGAGERDERRPAH